MRLRPYSIRAFQQTRQNSDNHKENRKWKPLLRKKKEKYVSAIRNVNMAANFLAQVCCVTQHATTAETQWTVFPMKNYVQFAVLGNEK